MVATLFPQYLESLKVGSTNLLFSLKQTPPNVDQYEWCDPNGVITHLESDILEYEVKWPLGSITMNKASVGDGISVHPKDQTWVFIGGSDVEAEIPILQSPDAKSRLIGKDPDAGQD